MVLWVWDGAAGLMGGSAGEHKHYCDNSRLWELNLCDNFDTEVHFLVFVLYYAFFLSDEPVIGSVLER
jgi:hypothetical protein